MRPAKPHIESSVEGALWRSHSGLTRRTQSRTMQASLKDNEMNTLTASEARANLYRLIDQTVGSHVPIIISGKRSSAVLLSMGD